MGEDLLSGWWLTGFSKRHPDIRHVSSEHQSLRQQLELMASIKIVSANSLACSKIIWTLNIFLPQEYSTLMKKDKQLSRLSHPVFASKEKSQTGMLTFAERGVLATAVNTVSRARYHVPSFYCFNWSKNEKIWIVRRSSSRSGFCMSSIRLDPKLAFYKIWARTCSLNIFYNTLRRQRDIPFY